jgi:hypothetical protein
MEIDMQKKEIAELKLMVKKLLASNMVAKQN